MYSWSKEHFPDRPSTPQKLGNQNHQWNLLLLYPKPSHLGLNFTLWEQLRVKLLLLVSHQHSSATAEAERKKVKRKCQNLLVNVMNMINMKDSVCLIDPFINPRKYCNWHVPSSRWISSGTQRNLASKRCFSVFMPACGSQIFLRTDLVVLWRAAKSSLTTGLMRKLQPSCHFLLLL